VKARPADCEVTMMYSGTETGVRELRLQHVVEWCHTIADVHNLY